MTVEYIQSRHSPDEATYLRDQVDGPLSSAESTIQEESHPQVLVRNTVHEETTEVLKDNKRTDSEDVVSDGLFSFFHCSNRISRSRPSVECSRLNEHPLPSMYRQKSKRERFVAAQTNIMYLVSPDLQFVYYCILLQSYELVERERGILLFNNASLALIVRVQTK